jgi:ABC-2 type transport system permease protein
MGTWLKGTRLVFERGLVENLRSKSFKVVTGLLLLLSIAAVTLPQLFRDDTTTYASPPLARRRQIWWPR